MGWTFSCTWTRLFYFYQGFNTLFSDWSNTFIHFPWILESSRSVEIGGVGICVKLFFCTSSFSSRPFLLLLFELFILGWCALYWALCLLVYLDTCMSKWCPELKGLHCAPELLAEDINPKPKIERSIFHTSFSVNFLPLPVRHIN